MCFVTMFLLGGCPKSDVGRPCNHGARRISAKEPFVTFPATACNDLLCVYSDSLEPPVEPCESDAQCNAQTGGEALFACIEGQCRVSSEHVLSKSMCSKRCESDADCEAERGTECKNGFACARLQAVGTFCCEKLCVCRDDLIVDADLEEACDEGMARGCCTRDPVPEGCG